MSRLEDRIPEDKAQEVFTLAAQLYAQHNQTYSVQELMEAGTEARIPPEFIQQAIDQLQIVQVPASTPLQQNRSKRSKVLLISLVTGLLALTGAFFLAKNAQVAQGEKAGVETVDPNTTQVSDANPIRTSIKKCEGLQGKDLRLADLQGADCANADLAGADLRGVNLQGANLSRADLKNAKLSAANLRDADLADADLTDADLSGADLQGANLSGTDLKKANLSAANLKDADLARADLEGANLTTANTEGVNFNNTTMPNGKVRP